MTEITVYCGYMYIPIMPKWKTFLDRRGRIRQSLCLCCIQRAHLPGSLHRHIRSEAPPQSWCQENSKRYDVPVTQPGTVSSNKDPQIPKEAKLQLSHQNACQKKTFGFFGSMLLLEQLWWQEPHAESNLRKCFKKKICAWKHLEGQGYRHNCHFREETRQFASHID